MKYFTYPKLFIMLILVTYAVSCGNLLGDNFWGDNNQWYGWETEIMSVDISPNPVETGEKITFTCIIKDSLNTSFYFLWIVNKDSSGQARTEENTFTIQAPDIPGDYEGNVYVTNDRPNYSAVDEDFTYQVIEKQE